MSSLTIGMVNYKNALPYTWALEELQEEGGLEIHVEKEVPSVTAASFRSGKYDICLLPCGSLDAKASNIYKLPFGICGDGAVYSVCLLSNQPLHEIRYILTDKESSTSNLLAKIIMQKILRQKVTFIEPPQGIKKLGNDEGFISIGDKAMLQRCSVKFVYDLAELWKTHTQLPFVFARWVARKNDTHSQTITRIEQKFASFIQQLESNLQQRSSLDEKTKDYLLHYIKYSIDEDAEKGLQYFLKLRDELM